MCILCVASRWSRRIVTMLPWLIIPLILVWALSQLFPPGFRLEVTSPRLACVGVLLLSLGWYELVMPRLSQWRARRTILLRERQRIEALEAAKWRKEAIRRCRNCLYAYREQQRPSGGRFMCTYCGHVSKRPVLELPNGVGGVPGMAGGSFHTSPHSIGRAALGTGIWNAKTVRGWGIRGWGEKSEKFVDHGGMGKCCNARGGRHTDSSWLWNFWPMSSRAALGFHWVGEAPGRGDNISFWLKNDFCSPGDHGRLYYLFKYIGLVFLMLKWVLTKRWAEEGVVRNDDPMGGGRMRGQRHGEDLSGSHGGRVEKAKRKAEERRLARLERKRLEEEERKQREEVAQLVEERRRLRDELLEAQRETEREAAAVRERESRREKEAEMRQQEKAKGKEKEKAKEVEGEDTKRSNESTDITAKEYQPEGDKRAVQKSSPSNFDDMKKSKQFRTVGAEARLKGTEFTRRGVGNSQKVFPSTHISPTNSRVPPVSKVGAPRSNSTSFWGNSFTFGGRSKGPIPPRATFTKRSSFPTDGSSQKLVSSSSWNKIPWTNVWGKSAGQTESSEEINFQPAAPDMKRTSAICDMQKTVPNLPDLQSRSSGSPFRFPSTVVVGQLECGMTRQHTDEHSLIQEIVMPSPICSTPEHLVPGGRNLQARPLGLSYVTDSFTDPVHVPVSTSVLPPISAPQSFNNLETKINTCTPMLPNIGTSLQTTEFTLSSLSSSISTSNKLLPLSPSISDSHLRSSSLAGPLSPPKNCIGQNVTPNRSRSSPESQVSKSPKDDTPIEGKWEMWDGPQLTQLQVSSVVEPLQWPLPSCKDGLEPKTAPLSKITLEPEDFLSYPFSPKQNSCSVDDNTGYLLSSLSLPPSSNRSLWLDQSAFQSARHMWEESDPQQQVPPEFVDCITREVMLDPVITADGHTYARSAIEFWLRTHDTSPITGKVLPPPPGGDGSGVDKTLRPNHILRGQIIEYNERAARGLTTQSSLQTGWSMFTCRESVPWSTIPSSRHIPGPQSVWTYDVSKG